jgi:hypothetical protein
MVTKHVKINAFWYITPFMLVPNICKVDTVNKGEVGSFKESVTYSSLRSHKHDLFRKILYFTNCRILKIVFISGIALLTTLQQ